MLSKEFNKQPTIDQLCKAMSSGKMIRVCDIDGDVYDCLVHGVVISKNSDEMIIWTVFIGVLGKNYKVVKCHNRDILVAYTN